MNERSFDKLIRDRLKDHESPVPTDMWGRIHPREDDRRFFFLWSSLAAAAGIAILSLLAWRILRNPAMPHSVHLFSAHLVDSAAAHPAPSASRPAPAARPAATPTSITPSRALTPAHPASAAPPISAATRPASASCPAKTSPHPTMPSAISKSRPLRPTETNPFLPHAPGISDSPDPFTLSAVAVQLPQHPLFRSTAILAKPLASSKPSPIPCWDPTRPSHPGTWSLNVYGASGIATGGPHSVVLYGAGFLLRKDILQGLSLASGLQYSWIKLKGLTDSLSRFGVRQITDLDLPVLVGYEKTYSGFQAAFDGGIIINLHSAPVGQYASFLQNLYRTSTGVSLYLGLRFTKELDDRLSLFAAPYYRRQLSDPAGNNSQIAQTFNIGGLLVGIKYNLKGRPKQ